MEEEKLVKNLKQGDIEAREFLVVHTQSYLFNVIFQVVRDRALAEDILEETFLKAFKYIKSFKGESRLLTWLYRIAMNIAKEELKKEKRVELTKIPQDENIPAEFTLDEKKKIIWEGLSHLSTEDREIITLIDIQGLPYDDVSYVLGIPEGTVKSRIARARDRLREEILKNNFFDKINGTF